MWYRWAAGLAAKASTLKTLVLSAGTDWWRQHDYPSHLPGCNTSNGVADAFTPLGSIGTLEAHTADTIRRACDPFDTKYVAMVTNVAIFLNAQHDFTGRVIVVTTPAGVRGCGSVGRPQEMPLPTARWETQPAQRGFWTHTNPQGGVWPPDAYGNWAIAGTLRSAEHVWRSAFQKHAPRLKLAVLNITLMSEDRVDTRAPSASGACEDFCWPGVPHAWAEMMLRLLEQSVYGCNC